MRLVILGDFHYSSLEEMDTEKDKQIFDIRDKYYEKVIYNFLKTKGDYHISLGDLTNYGNKQELEYVCSAMKNKGVNFIHVLGNHDSYSLSKNDILSITKQERYFSICEDNSIMIFIDSTLETNHERWAGYMDEVQLQWLKNEIIHSTDKTILIFSHHPVYGTTTFSKDENLYIEQIEELNRILALHKGRGIFFCGHNHANSICKRDNWYFVQTAATLDINAFRVVDIYDDKIKLDYKEVDNVSELSKNLGSNMLHFSLKDNAVGNEEDRRLEILNDVIISS